MSADPRRPTSHVTVETGWLNDAYGITWLPDADRYVMFFQHFPDAVAFDPRMTWAGTQSPDLVRWSRPEVVLRPDGGDVGCWSGSAVLTTDGLRLLYTRVDGISLDRGRVVLVDPANPDVGEVVIPGPPDGLGSIRFRDPFVWAAPDGGWRMLMGAAIGADEGAVFAYSAPDLRTWTYEGVACRRQIGAGAPGEDWTGSMWECPQLIEVDGAWVLILSVGQDAPAHVVYAVGELQWPRFTPGVWRRLWSGEAPYATTAFRDRDGRPCALSWCRETVPDPTSEWAGTLSYPYVLRRSGDRVYAAPHPDVERLRGRRVVDAPPFRAGPQPREFPALGAQVDLVVRAILPAGGVLTLALRQDDGDLLVVTIDRRADRARLSGRGWPDLDVALGGTVDGALELRLLLDASVAEVVTGAATAIVRTAPSAGPVRLSVSGGPDGAQVQQLSVHVLEASVHIPDASVHIPDASV